MFQNTNLLYVLGPAIFVWVVASLFARLRASREQDPMMRAWKQFKLSIIAISSILVLLWFMLPSTPALSTFGYPQDIEVVNQPARLLNLLRDYNRALVRTTEVVYWLLFIIVWWFMSSLHSFAKALTASRRNPGPPSEDRSSAQSSDLPR